MLRTSILAVTFAALASTAYASPCDGLARNLTENRKIVLEKEAAKQLHVQKTDVLQVFKLDDWAVVYVDTYQSDEAYLFFSGDPLTHQYMTLWGGAAMANEEQEIENWALQNAPGIPEKLAGCFAWQVTQNHIR